MAKSTHSGTCQCCLNTQKLPSNKLSKHGYTVESGYFSGTCHGAGHLPLELSCDLIPSIIEGLMGYKESIAANLARFVSGELVVVSVTVSEPSKFNPNRMVRKIKEKIIPSIGTGLKAEAIKENNRGMVGNLERTIELTNRQIQERQEILENWVAKPENLIEEEAKQEVLHLAVVKFKLNTAACVASRMGAKQWKYTTEDESKVTCKRCLKAMANK